MIKVFLFLIFLSPSVCFAETSGYLFLSKYFDYDKATVEGRQISYRAGVYLEIKKTRWPTFFMQDETLITNIEGGKAYPKQINYKIGIKQKIKSFELIVQHECLHPVDGISGGNRAEVYDMIEGRYNF